MIVQGTILLNSVPDFCTVSLARMQPDHTSLSQLFPGEGVRIIQFIQTITGHYQIIYIKPILHHARTCGANGPHGTGEYNLIRRDLR